MTKSLRDVIARAMHDADFSPAHRTEAHYRSDQFFAQHYGGLANAALTAMEAWEPPELDGMPFGSGAAWRALLAAARTEET